MEGSQDTLPVNLAYVQKEGPRTIANLTLYFYGWAIKSISLSELSEQDYIMNIWHLNFKQVEGKYYMTFKFTEPAVPGGSGGGAGGMDFNTYLGYIQLDEELSFVHYEQKLIQRGALQLGQYKVIEGKPEKGIVEKEEK